MMCRQIIDRFQAGRLAGVKNLGSSQPA